jgi:uncharacterized membrane protein
VYPSEARPEEVRQKTLKLQSEYLITINDAVIAVKTGDSVKLNPLVSTRGRRMQRLVETAIGPS